jgi:hypothetical protein
MLTGQAYALQGRAAAAQQQQQDEQVEGAVAHAGRGWQGADGGGAGAGGSDVGVLLPERAAGAADPLVLALMAGLLGCVIWLS